MSGFGMRYFFIRSSRKRSGSNSNATRCIKCGKLSWLLVRDKRQRLPSGPHRSVLRCIAYTEYAHLVPAGMKKGWPPCGAGQIKSCVAYRQLKGLQKFVNPWSSKAGAEGDYTGGNSLSVSDSDAINLGVSFMHSFVTTYHLLSHGGTSDF